MSYIDFLGGNNYLALNRNILRELGPIEGILYSEIVDEYKYWRDRGELDKENMFFSTVENIGRRTGIGRNQQVAALKGLEGKGLIRTKKKGLPAKRYIFVVEDDEVLKKYFENYDNG